MKAKKLPSGNYRVQVIAGIDDNGKRKVKSFTAETEWEALRLAEEFKETQHETTGKNITVRNAIEEYINSRQNILEKQLYATTEKYSLSVFSQSWTVSFISSSLLIFRRQLIMKVQALVLKA